ncbi:hypothetical protein [Williamwhitmania taraxaci]|uniref:Uncharacterized protein n=1 Tax=Williamwhitmania taraxaci TaxID=1640674 RepID=A0A1G6M9R8_9BACT|nr:hypothetical protein [Williamwhitmania taraxaci]SDC52200.1 hypothetical protein SAMN05216323_103510 [Williamwhitmania taraxaci]
MNRIDLLKYPQFPMSSETLAFLQDMVTLTAKLSSIGGNTYILEGCELLSGNRVSPGTLVINGEVLPFTGGLTTSNVSIQESKDSVQVYDETYADLYMNRTAVASTGSGSIPWSSFQRLPSLASMAQSLASLDTALTGHITDHTVAWDKVSGKPATFSPAAHNHAWSAISEKPTTFPPSAHSHAAGPVFIGWTNWQGGPANPQGDGMIQVVVTKIQEGCYKITHNLGHVRYIVLGGSGVNSKVSIRSMYDINANDCMIVCSDDGSANDCNLYFTIITM